MNSDRLSYFLIRALTYPISWMPFSWIHKIGKGLGVLAYYLMKEYRKRALSNLSLATELALTPKQTIRLAKESFQNLAINCLEYARLDRAKTLSTVIQCENPEIAQTLYEKGQGIIFFCGHQSNWEVLFLDGTTRMKGIAIGKSIKNKKLYRWIVSIREKMGGKIIAPHNAVKEGFRALKKGAFMGIVGDQGMPDSGYSFPFLGRRAWTSTAPALLAYRTNSPIIFASTRRIPGGYRIRYSDPIWPDLTKPADIEVVRMMNQALTLLQESIKLSPGEWLWQHNRWKQETPQIIYKRFRHDCVLVILPENDALLSELLIHLNTLKTIYQKAFLTVLAPRKAVHAITIVADEILTYDRIEETKLLDYRFKLVFDFNEDQFVKRHYLQLSAFEVVNIKELRKLAAEDASDLSAIFNKALCRSS